MFGRILANSRFLVALAVISTFLGAVVLLVASVVTVARVIWEQVTKFDFAQWNVRQLDHLSVQFIQVTDAVLLGTVLYIIAMGLYQLFVNSNLPVPSWLKVRDLAELKRDLLAVTIVLLGVTFLGEAVEWQEGEDILPFGLAIALVVLALGFILWLMPANGESGDKADNE